MKKCFLIGTLFFLMSISCFAVDLTKYQITVPVASQSQDDWQKGVVDGLSQLLINVSGDEKILESPKVKNSFAQAQNFVRSFTYIAPDSNNPQMQLQIQFYPQSINQLINQSAVTQASLENNPQPQQITLHITQVSGLNDYADVMQYLRGLAPVTNVDSSNINSNDLVLTATVNGGAQALLAAINTGTQMQQVTNTNPTDTALYFRWIATNSNTNNPPNGPININNQSNTTQDQPSQQVGDNTDAAPMSNGDDVGP